MLVNPQKNQSKLVLWKLTGQTWPFAQIQYQSHYKIFRQLTGPHALSIPPAQPCLHRMFAYNFAIKGGLFYPAPLLRCDPLRDFIWACWDIAGYERKNQEYFEKNSVG